MTYDIISYFRIIPCPLERPAQIIDHYLRTAGGKELGVLSAQAIAGTSDDYDLSIIP